MNFVSKHKRILLLGALLALVFGILTALSTGEEGAEIMLTQFITRERPGDDSAVSDTQPTSTQPVITPAETPESTSPQQTFPDMTISFVEGVGFTPSSKNAAVGQRIVIVNTTLVPIDVQELFPGTTSLASGVTIESGQSFSFTLNTTGLVTYRELGSLKTGRFWVGNPN